MRGPVAGRWRRKWRQTVNGEALGEAAADKWPTSRTDGRQIANDTVNDTVLSRTEASVFSALEGRGGSTTRELAEATGLSARTTRRVLSKLVELGLVVASGANKNRSYRIPR